MGVVGKEKCKSLGGLSCDKGRSALHPEHGDEAEKRFHWEREGWRFHLKILSSCKRCLGQREVQGRETASGTIKMREEFVARLG